MLSCTGVRRLLLLHHQPAEPVGNKDRFPVVETADRARDLHGTLALSLAVQLSLGE
jgi:hypothetical protein